MSPQKSRTVLLCLLFANIFKSIHFVLFLNQVLQKLGKADETKDEQFEEYVQNFKRQEVSPVS